MCKNQELCWHFEAMTAADCTLDRYTIILLFYFILLYSNRAVSNSNITVIKLLLL